MFTTAIYYLTQSADNIFWILALAGTIFFAMRLLMFMIGGAFEMFADADMHTDHDDYSTHGDALSFRLFTLHSLSGFLMMFGWVGLACSKNYDLSAGQTMVVALVAGIVTMLLTAALFWGAQRFVSKGTQFDIHKTIGLVGTVYQQITPDYPGKVNLIVDGVTREVLAHSGTGKQIDSFVLVKVSRVLDHESVVVDVLDSHTREL
jgi:hypothetical protein